jgi:hypothetical protein
MNVQKQYGMEAGSPWNYAEGKLGITRWQAVRRPEEKNYP